MADVNISKYRASVVRDGSKPASPGFVVSEGQDPVNPPGTNNFVPYTGATANVELGEFGLETGFVTLDTTPTNIPTDQGAIYWDDAKSTAALIMNGTLQHIGQDTFFYVKNSSGSSIPKGTAVRFAGTDGASGHLLIEPFLANGTYPSSYFMGVTAETIANGSFGQVTNFGELNGINTSGYTAGALLYASSTVAGAFQTTAPVAPNNIVLIAAAVNSKNNGEIIVRPQIGSNINNDEGVKITSGATGDLLQLQAGGLWENKTLAQVIGSAYVPSTRTITINGTTQDLSANRTFNVGTVTSVGLSSATSGVTIGSSPVTTSGTITLAIATASGSQNGLLSSTDWTTFNNKQNALTNPVTGTGTTNYLPKFTGASTIGNSQVFDNGTNVGIGTANPLLNLQINSASGSNSTLAFSENNGLKWYARYNAGDGSFSIVDVVNTATRLIINTSGNLGLGVTPSAWNSSVKVIEIANTGNFIGNSGQDNWLATNTIYDSGATFRYARTGSAVAFYSQSSGGHFWFNAPSGTAGNAISFTQAMTLNASGNLLVGTTTDNGARLQVSGGNVTVSDSASPRVFVTGNTSTGFPGFNLSNTTQAYDIIVRGNASNAFQIRNTTASTDLITITSGGNVGIGTSSPTGRLQVKDNGYRQGIVLERGGTTTARGFLYVGDGTNSTIADEIYFDANNTDFHFRTGSGGTDTRLRITVGGNVLIGTTSDAGFKLDVNGSGVFRNTLALQSSGTNAALLSWTSSNNGLLNLYNGGSLTTQILASGNSYFNGGNVGIGTSSPVSNLSISGSSDVGVRIKSGASALSYIDFDEADSGAPNGSIAYNNINNSMTFSTGGSNTERMRITSGGNVLIGTTTDNGARLQVSGGNVTITNSGNVFSTIKTTTNTGVAAYLCQNDINTTTEIGNWGSTRSGFGAIQPNNGYIFSGDELAIGGSLGLKFGTGGSNTTRLTISSTGAATFSSSVTATSFFESSDASLKTLVEDNYQAEGIANVTAKLYIKNGKKELGYYAQDLQDVLPSAVSKDSDGLLNLSYREVHTAKIAYLEERIKQLENELGKFSK